jgi:hypothetical protein
VLAVLAVGLSTQELVVAAVLVMVAQVVLEDRRLLVAKAGTSRSPVTAYLLQ